jgi:SWI/SNF-related matrix-associated actin-dependent regulator of chromatin subfamily A3
MLDLIHGALSPHLSSLNLSSTRIDGSCTLQQRRDALDRFNTDRDCVVMLATVGAVGEGYVFSIPA